MKNPKPLPVVFLWAVFLCLIPACAPASAGPGADQDLAQLRIHNVGQVDITAITVIFPGATYDAGSVRVEFGKIPARTISEYRNVPGGVYRYAAYDYVLDGERLNQYVIDWVGESPMHGAKFTYNIQLDPQAPENRQVIFHGCSIDELEETYQDPPPTPESCLNMGSFQ
jgi:hypothetical protein